MGDPTLEFLVVFLPLALIVDFGWLWIYLANRRLVRQVRIREPLMFDDLRGRPRRWYDPSDEVLIQQPTVRSRFRALLAPLVADDAELATRLREVEAAYRVLRSGVWLGSAISLLLTIWMLVRFR